MDTDVIDQLRERLGRYPPARYPVQHATTQFHLGQALLQGGLLADAAAALEGSLGWFPEAMAVERAKVHNLLGAVRRSQGDLDAAAAAFHHAAEVFAAEELAAEEGAALFNLGLLRRDAGDPAAAVSFFEQARERMADGALAPRAMVSLHLGKALLEAGEVEAAVMPLERAVDAAERLGDLEGMGVAANALGLAHLATGRPGAAVEALHIAVGAHPRSVRPSEFAMAKANLALAHEAGDSPCRARLAARQALAVDDPPIAVVEQAQAVLDRAGPPSGSDLLAVLDEEPEESWPGTVREEVVRWASLPPDPRRAEAATFIAGVATRMTVAEQLVHAWLSALMELPPADMDAVVTGVLQAGDDVDPTAVEGFRARTERVMAWFPVPQLLRLRDRFAHLAAGLGEGAAWNCSRT